MPDMYKTIFLKYETQLTLKANLLIEIFHCN